MGPGLRLGPSYMVVLVTHNWRSRSRSSWAKPTMAFSRSCVGTHEYLAPELSNESTLRNIPSIKGWRLQATDVDREEPKMAGAKDFIEKLLDNELAVKGSKSKVQIYVIVTLMLPLDIVVIILSYLLSLEPLIIVFEMAREDNAIE
ncbi:hypothetical protein Salat_1875600 [Sesamum alatum]|uniref:Uncharacterized protein n=1 Tax=Sesamum alatum TaxID=300844 RepID=A0AAE2CI29_9LAMI|nr:hypothetical protein Salat_1875600 [Sesamum alatum]